MMAEEQALMRYRLRTLLILLAILPPLLAGLWFLVQSALGALLVAIALYFVASLFLGPPEDSR